MQNIISKISNYQREKIVIYGNSRSGKSTIITKLTDKLIDSTIESKRGDKKVSTYYKTVKYEHGGRKYIIWEVSGRIEAIGHYDKFSYNACKIIYMINILNFDKEFDIFKNFFLTNKKYRVPFLIVLSFQSLDKRGIFNSILSFKNKDIEFKDRLDVSMVRKFMGNYEYKICLAEEIEEYREFIFPSQ